MEGNAVQNHEKRLAVKRLLADDKGTVADNNFTRQPTASAARTGKLLATEFPAYPLTCEVLNAAGASPPLAQRILSRLAAMPRDEREQVQEMLREMLI